MLFGMSTLTVAAASVANTSPTTAAVIDNQAHPIAANSSAWYRFDYAGDKSQILITLANGNDSGLAFNVFTPTQIGDWWETAPIGKGTSQPVNCTSGEPQQGAACQSDNLFWSGNFNAGGTYYVEVVNNTANGLSAPLMIQGSGVMLAPVSGVPASNMGGAAVPSPKMPSTSAAPSAGSVANIDPSHAMLINNAAHPIPANASLWYSFNYAGDKSQITLTLPNGDVSGLQFNVWTPSQIGDWWDLSPIGRGTAQNVNCDTGVVQENGACRSNDLIWTGNFNASGTFYVQVTNTTSNSVSAPLMVQGSGVALGQ